MLSKWKNNPDLFCYVCGSFTIKAQRRSITPDLKKIYFGCPLRDQDKQWAPHQICTSLQCLAKLTEQENFSNAFCYSNDMEET